VRLVPFIALTTLGCALWALALVLTGFIAGAAWVVVSSMLAKVLLVVGLALVLLCVITHRKG
jgi:membrane protein DedA with SNARE-associated domain